MCVLNTAQHVLVDVCVGEQCEVACGQEKVKAQEIGAGFGRYVVITDGGGGREKYTRSALIEHLPWLLTLSYVGTIHVLHYIQDKI